LIGTRESTKSWRSQLASTMVVSYVLSSTSIINLLILYSRNTSIKERHFQESIAESKDPVSFDELCIALLKEYLNLIVCCAQHTAYAEKIPGA
jgi:hypothetical protein